MFNFNCELCSFTTDYKCNLLRHIKVKHTEPKRPASVNSFQCPLCNEIKARPKDLLYHYKTFHSLDVDEVCYEFDDQLQFQEWKRKIEDTDKTFYVVESGYPRSGDKIKKTLHCHRNGFHKDKGNNIRKSKGSNKINGYCPSRMRTITDVNTGHVTVYFTSLHVGHTNEIERLPFKKADKLVLAQKLVAGASQMKNTNDTPVQMDDANVDDLVNEIVSSNDMFRFFKPQGKLMAEHPALDVDDFMLVISTDHQLSLLERYGPSIVVMNGTHGLNPSSIVLTSILAVHSDRVFPCAFLLSNRTDVEIMSLFIQIVRDKMDNDVQVATFMTDVAGVYYDSWCNVMPPPRNRLLATFLVEQAWKRNLVKISDRTKRECTLKSLRKLVDESDEDAFFRLLPATVAHLLADPVTSEFGEYFASEFVNNYRSWAYCFRECCGASTDKNLKSMCKTLKRVCCQGKKTIRLEKAVPSLLDFVTNEKFEHTTSDDDNDAQKVSIIQQRHESSRSIPMHHVVESGDGWTVKAQDSDDFYFVESKSDSCECNLKCEGCRCCLHSYRCSCSDNCVDNNMCEHIHLVAFLRAQTSMINNAEICVSPIILENHSMEVDRLVYEEDPPEAGFIRELDIVEDNPPQGVGFVNENDPSVTVELIGESDFSETAQLIRRDDPAVIRANNPQTAVELVSEDPSVRIREDPSETEDTLLEELSAYIRKPDQDVALKERVSKMWAEIRNELKFTSDYEVLERALKPVLPAILAARQHQGEIFWVGQD
ncbi:Zinc finger protein [Nesidiocoris tenuis]|uniref:Zinc finger protein n=2 Tax=Nesidiocoris tenuis TaxID=355587 RepID=A0ABN7AZP6_9HEMI|nr:Zinc finger protein [Nesidiocoris tenuis]